MGAGDTCVGEHLKLVVRDAGLLGTFETLPAAARGFGLDSAGLSSGREAAVAEAPRRPTAGAGAGAARACCNTEGPLEMASCWRAGGAVTSEVAGWRRLLKERWMTLAAGSYFSLGPPSQSRNPPTLPLSCRCGGDGAVLC